MVSLWNAGGEDTWMFKSGLDKMLTLCDMMLDRHNALVGSAPGAIEITRFEGLLVRFIGLKKVLKSMVPLQIGMKNAL